MPRLDPVTESLLTLVDSDRERLNRYALNWSYYKASQYLGELGKQYAKEKKLFKHMRRVFGVVTKVVDTDARFVMKKRIDIDAVPKFQDPIREVWDRSNLQSEKYKLVRFGSNLGDAFLIVRDMGGGEQAVPQIVVANSEDMTVYRDPDDQSQVLKAKQSYDFFGNDGRPHTRDWLYYQDRIERYTDTDLDEGYPAPHPFGEVPVIPIQAIDIGEENGLSSWHNVQGQVDEVNELGSYMNRILLRYADPTLVASGMTPNDKPVLRKGLSQDNVYYLSSPEARLTILEYEGDVLPHIIAQIDNIADNIKDQLPEMSLDKIRDQSGLSGYAVSLHAADFLAKVDELRGNFGDGLERANALCLRATLNSTAPLEELKTSIVYEPALPEDIEQKLRAWETEKRLGIVSRKELLRRQGLDEKEIAARLQEVEDDQSAQGFGLGRLLGDQDGGEGGEA